MKDRFNRIITYLRISVTDRCNLRCVYCMPEEGVALMPRARMLSFEEILSITRTAVDMGMRKVRLTGGEPLVRRDIVRLVSMLSAVHGIKDLSMSTNGVFLSQFAGPLADAGLQRVNISLDSVNPRRYAEITRGGSLKEVLAGIDAAGRAGLEPIKLNCVIVDPPDRKDAEEVAEFGRRNGLQVRFIHRMNLAGGEFRVVEGGTGGDCPSCNRLRLSSDGMVRPCLFSDLAFSVRRLGAREAIRRAVEEKPERGVSSLANSFYSVGG